MVFSSTVFLFIFLPAVWLLYMLIPSRFLAARNLLLAIASLLFYAYGEPVYIIIMLGSVLFNWFMALLMSKHKLRTQSVICTLCVAIDLAILAFFKYIPWLTSLVNSALPFDIPVPPLTIPVGISFYTFQILSYVVDVRNGKTEVQKSFANLLLYISFFPQLIAGPIVKYGDIKEQIVSRSVTLNKTALGIRRFIYGLSKKVLISNSAAIIAEAAFGADMPSALLAWSGAVCYCIQLYFDFSGYSDMAIGLASMFGFSLLENFNYPYSAVSIRDFWKRWHISLTTWFREYVYIPLGGNRRGKVRTVINRLMVFFLTGLWHGANFTYIVWGMWQGLLMMLEQFTNMEKWTKKPILKPLFHIYTLLAVCLGFVVFNSPSMSFAVGYIGRMFSFGGAIGDATALFSPYTVMMVVFGIIFSLPVLPTIRKYIARNEKLSALGEVIGYSLSIPLFALCVMTLASTSFNPFIYYIF